MKRAELRDIHKKFDSNTALAGVTLSFLPGELHTILGENGAGKSTLVHILSGLHQPTSGSIHIGGQNVTFTSPSQAISAGIAMVHQRPLLSDELTVLENIILGSPGWKLSMTKRKKEVEDLAAKWQIQLNFTAPARSLSASDRLFTALLGALYRSPDFLILDEPSGVFAPEERDNFFTSLRRARTRGLGIIIITHRIEEAFKWSDRISVLKEGLLVFSELINNSENKNLSTFEKIRFFLTPPEIEKMLQPRLNKPSVQTDRGKLQEEKQNEGELNDGKAFEVTSLSFQKPHRPELKDVFFTADAGEIVGIFGLPESGLTSLEDILSGMIKPDTGTITINDSKLRPHQINPARLRNLGIGFVPQDRSFRASHPALTIKEILIPYQQFQFFRNKTIETLFVEKILTLADVLGPESRSCSTLSGGQLQRLILSRELANEPKVLILSEPDWGLDIRSTEQLKTTLQNAAKKGMAIIILTDNPDALKADNFFTKTYTLFEGRLS